MGALLGFLILGIPCAITLLWFLTPNGRRWLRHNGLL